eukprot:UN19418
MGSVRSGQAKMHSKIFTKDAIESQKKLGRPSCLTNWCREDSLMAIILNGGLTDVWLFAQLREPGTRPRRDVGNSSSIVHSNLRFRGGGARGSRRHQLLAVTCFILLIILVALLIFVFSKAGLDVLKR